MGAFLAPILIIVVLNVIIFICVIIVVIRHARDKAARIKRPISNKSILRLMISMSGVLFLFGLTWGFFILTLISLSLVSEKRFKFSLLSLIHFKGSLCLHLSSSQKDLATGRPSCHVKHGNQSLSSLLSKCTFLKRNNAALIQPRP